MKKRLLLLSMVSGLALVGCGGISQINDQNKQVIVKLGDGTSYTADDLFDNYSSTQAGASQYFDAIYDVLIRAVQPITNSINRDVQTKLDEFVASARSAASTNGTSYRTELSNALEQQGVESLAELEEIYTLDVQKTAFEDNYYDGNDEENLNNLLKEFIEYYAPYHVRHILVNTSSGTSLYNGTLTQEDAENLAYAVKLLAEGNLSFGAIAQEVSGDTDSADRYAETSITATTTSFVNEFKFALYQYDEFYNANATAAIEAYDARQEAEVDSGFKSTNYVAKSDSKLIPLNDEDKEYVKSKLNRIPYSVFVELNEYANITKNVNTGLQVMDGNESYYPRNIIFNKYLNEHCLSVITRGEGEDAITSPGSNFKHVDGLSASSDPKDNVLVADGDETKPILVTRSGSGDGESGYQGIFFIIAQKSPFTTSENQTNEQLIDSLVDYYTMDIDEATQENAAPTYIGYIQGTNQSYTERQNNIKSLVEGFDSHMNFRFFQTAYEQAVEQTGSVTFSRDIETLINAYIEAARDTASYSANETYQNAWDSYVDLLQLQDQLVTNEVGLEYIDMFFTATGTNTGGQN